MMNDIFQQGMFQVNPDSTPDMLARKRAQISRLMSGRAKYTGEGLAKLATGVVAGIKGRNMDTLEGEKTAEATEAFNRALGGGFAAPQGAGTPFMPDSPLQPQEAAMGARNMAMANNGGPTKAAAVAANATGGNMAATVRQGLIARGLPEHIADGFVMNMQDESGLNPSINEAKPLVPGSRGGFGLYQLTGPRRREFEAFAAQRGVGVGNVDAQLDFLMKELSGSEASAAKHIFAAKDAGTAGAAIVNKFLRPSEQHRARRAAKYLGGAAPSYGGGAAPSGGGMQMPPQRDMTGLYQALQNPWLNPQQKAVITSMIAQQQGQTQAMQAAAMKQQDPLYQAQLAKMQADMNAPEPRQMLKGADGRTYYVDTGEPVLPNVQVEAEQGYEILTPEAVKAMGLPEGAYQRSADGKVSKIGGGGVTVNNNSGSKFSEEFAKGDAKALSAISEAGMAAQRNITRIDQLESLLAKSPTGFGGVIKQAAGEFGINTEGLDDVQATQALINSMVPEQRQEGSGPMSDADLALFKQSLPRVINQPGGNRIIIDTMRKIAVYDAKGAEIVQRVRAGELTRAEAFSALQSRANPLAGFKAGKPEDEKPVDFSDFGAPLHGPPDEDGWHDAGGLKIRVRRD